MSHRLHRGLLFGIALCLAGGIPARAWEWRAAPWWEIERFAADVSGSNAAAPPTIEPEMRRTGLTVSLTADDLFTLGGFVGTARWNAGPANFAGSSLDLDCDPGLFGGVEGRARWSAAINPFDLEVRGRYLAFSSDLPSAGRVELDEYLIDVMIGRKIREWRWGAGPRFRYWDGSVSSTAANGAPVAFSLESRDNFGGVAYLEREFRGGTRLAVNLALVSRFDAGISFSIPVPAFRREVERAPTPPAASPAAAPPPAETSPVAPTSTPVRATPAPSATAPSPSAPAAVSSSPPATSPTRTRDDTRPRGTVTRVESLPAPVPVAPVPAAPVPAAPAVATTARPASPPPSTAVASAPVSSAPPSAAPPAASTPMPSAQSWKALIELANDLAESERLDSAIALYERVLANDPGHFQARFNLATCLYLAGRLREAEQEYEHAVILQPDDAEAWLFLGLSAQRNNHPARARQAFRQALDLDPENEVAQQYLGR